MTTRPKNLFLLPAFAICLGLLLAFAASAQTYTYTNVHVFMGSPSDGSQPQCPLLLSGNTLYGTTSAGGSNGSGTVFKVGFNGSNYSNLYSFSVLSFPFAPHTNSDGASPVGGLVLSGNTLFGTAYNGGSAASGTIFRVNIDGSGFTNLYTFTNGNDGSFPVATLVLSGNTLYGTATSGGSNGDGSVFSIRTDGSHFTNLYSFTDGLDGSIPDAGLILSGGTLYGTTTSGGNDGSGAVFALSTNGSGFTNLYDFTPADPDSNTNSDGAYPQAPLIISGNTLYGTTSAGGLAGTGTVFSVNTNGSNYTVLHTFSDFGDYGPNSDGAVPEAGLLLFGSTLYGTTEYGGTSGYGAIFAIDLAGPVFTNLHSFANSPNESALPQAGLTLANGNLYGTEYSDFNSEGAVFALLGVVPVPPQLTITRSGANVVLTWPAGVTGYTLEAATNLVPSPTWTNLSGQFSVTDPISGTKKFYRLIH